ncbi:MAG: 50S ribosomal protein L30 [SAR324 cluster bacterium]|uniref:50S ribosomal protein L30 n=1 Tax=SAR324 cluster bacterium TaxID=2024889 RepID=A0A2A4TB07_9DELT|nr:MAG: 50S ribosomal protein L30 [SAR324 cluster bacterium]
MAGQITVQLVRSGIGRTQRQRATLQGLGLKKLRQVRVLNDTPEVRGMVNKVQHLVKVLD